MKLLIILILILLNCSECENNKHIDRTPEVTSIANPIVIDTNIINNTTGRYSDLTIKSNLLKKIIGGELFIIDNKNIKPNIDLSKISNLDSVVTTKDSYIWVKLDPNKKYNLKYLSDKDRFFSFDSKGNEIKSFVKEDYYGITNTTYLILFGNSLKIKSIKLLYTEIKSINVDVNKDYSYVYETANTYIKFNCNCSNIRIFNPISGSVSLITFINNKKITIQPSVDSVTIYKIVPNKNYVLDIYYNNRDRLFSKNTIGIYCLDSLL